MKHHASKMSTKGVIVGQIVGVVGGYSTRI